MSLFKRETCCICGKKGRFKVNNFDCLGVKNEYICDSCKGKVANLELEKYTLPEVKLEITKIQDNLYSKFIEGPMPEEVGELELMDSYESIPVVGTTHNFNGENTQGNIANLKNNERVYLIQHEMKEELSTIRVVNDCGKHLGWLPKDDEENDSFTPQKIIATNIDQSTSYLCRIAKIDELKIDNAVHLYFCVDISFYL